jgi:hypothetical protein
MLDMATVVLTEATLQPETLKSLREEVKSKRRLYKSLMGLLDQDNPDREAMKACASSITRVTIETSRSNDPGLSNLLDVLIETARNIRTGSVESSCFILRGVFVGN